MMTVASEFFLIICIHVFFYQSILDPVSKAVALALKKSPVKYSLVVELCFLCSRSFNRVSRLFSLVDYLITFSIFNVNLLFVDHFHFGTILLR